MSPGPNPGPVSGRVLGGFDFARSQRVRIGTWFDPMVMVAVVHAFLLVGVGEPHPPTAVLWIVTALVGWHLLVLAVAPARISWLVRDAGSHVATAAVVAIDGGTESPFFFWVLLFLAGQAIRHPVSSFRYLAGIALASYLAVVAVTEASVAALGRFGLLMAFCGVVAYLRSRLDHEAEEAREVDHVMWTAFDSAPIGMVLIDDEMSVVYANPPATRLMGFLDESTRVHLGTGEEMSIVDAFASTEQMSGPELVRLSGRAGDRHLRVLSVPVEVARHRRVLVFAEDVTQIVASGEERTRFLQAAAHQFRTPLTPIMGYAAMLAEENLPPEHITEAAEAIHTGAIRLEQLLDRLTTLLSLKLSAQRPPTSVDVGAVVESALRGYEGMVECSGAGDVLILCDAEAAALGMGELVANGGLHGRPPVTVRVNPVEDGVEVHISDAGDGPPIPDAAPLDRAWSVRFPDNVVSAHMGVQLGLSQAHSLLELAGAELSFRRRDDGWCFVVLFALGSD